MILGPQDQSTEFDEHVRAKVREVLLKKHHHQNEKKRNNLLPIVRSFADVSKKQSDLHLLDKPGEGSCRVWHQVRVPAGLWSHSTCPGRGEASQLLLVRLSECLSFSYQPKHSPRILLLPLQKLKMG